MQFITYDTKLNFDYSSILDEIRITFLSMRKFKEFLELFDIQYQKKYLAYVNDDHIITHVSDFFHNKNSELAVFTHNKWVTSIILIKIDDTEKMYNHFTKYKNIKTFI